MSTTPPDPKNAAKQALTSAVIWAVLSAAFAALMFVYSGNVEQEKRTFYLIAGGIGAVATVVNGYNAWVQFQKSKPPK